MITLPKILKIPILLFVVFNETPHIKGHVINGECEVVIIYNIVYKQYYASLFVRLTKIKLLIVM